MPSLMRKLRCSAASMLKMPGPSRMFRPALPSVFCAGVANAETSKYFWPGPVPPRYVTGLIQLGRSAFPGALTMPETDGENQVPGPIVPIVAVPTTAGTGSEVTPVAVVSDPERELKVGISSPFLVPAVAIVDPEFTLGSPATVTAFSGIDALVHAVESYTARPLDVDWSAPLPVFTGRNALAEPIALQAARHLGPWLSVAVRQPEDRRARQEVAVGSLLGGLAFGSTGTHLCHALQYPIGAMTKTPHGLGTGLMLPYMLDALLVESENAVRIAALGAALEDLPAEQASPDRTISRIVAINREIGVPATLAEIGLDRDQLPRIADLALGSARLLAIAPVEPSRDLLLEILERAHHGVLTDRSVA